MAHLVSHLPFELHAEDPNFAREMRSWAFETRCQMNELVLKTLATIDTTRALMVEVDWALVREAAGWILPKEADDAAPLEPKPTNPGLGFLY